MAYLIGLFLLLTSAPAFADPFSVIASVIITAGGLTGWSAFFVALAGSVFGMARARRQQKKAAAAARAEYNASLQDRSQTVLQSNPPARVCYGTATFAGSPVAIFTTGDKDQYKHVVIEWAHHECDAVLDYLIDGVSLGALDANGAPTEGKYSGTSGRPMVLRLTTDVNGEVAIPETNAEIIMLSSAAKVLEDGTTEVITGGYIENDVFKGGPPNTEVLLSILTTASGGHKIRIHTHLGDSSNNTADAYLMSVVPDKWTSAHKLLGRCYSVVTLDLNEQEFQSGFPQLTAKIRGKKVFDPRTEEIAWSDNAALCIADYISSPLGKNSNFNTIILSDLIASANICDEEITPVGGEAYAKYTINGVFTTNDDPLESMAMAMAGVVSCPGGWSIMAGAYSAPILDLGEDDFVGDFEIANGVSRADLFNGVTGMYFPVENPLAESEFKTYSNTAYVAADGEELYTDLNYPFTNTANRVEQLNRIAVEDARQAMTIKCGASLKAWGLRIGHRVTVTNSLFGISSKVFRVMDWSMGVTSPVMLTLKEDAVGIWDAADDTQYDQAPNNDLPTPFTVGDVEILSVESGTDHLIVGSDGKISSRAYVTYTPSNDVLVTSGGWLDVELNKPDIDDVFRAWPRADGSSSSLYLYNVEDGYVYNIRLRWNNSVKAGDWAYTAHRVLGKLDPPPPFDVFYVDVQPDGTRALNFGYTTTQKPVDWAGAEVRYTPGEHAVVDWDQMYLLNDEGTFFTVSPSEVNRPADGLFTFACRSRDTSGTLSTSKLHTITLPKRRQGNTVAEFTDIFDGAKVDCHYVGTGGLLNPGNFSWTEAGTWAAWGEWGSEATYVPGTETGYLEADDTTTWSDLEVVPWTDFTSWVLNPEPTIEYTTLVKDIGLVVTGLMSVTCVAEGDYTIELRYSETSDDPVAYPTEWSAWGSTDVNFTARYFQLRVTVDANVTYPVATIRSLSIGVTAPIARDYVNNADISAYTGSYRIGTGDVRVPLPRSYAVLIAVQPVVQDSSAGQWTHQLIDKDTTVGPRVQFKLDGTLADPALVDFVIEGFEA